MTSSLFTVYFVVVNFYGVSPKCQAPRDAENRRATLSAIFAHTRIASQIQPRTCQRPSISTTLDNQLTSKIPPSCQAKPDTVRLHLQRIPNLHESATSPGPRRKILCSGKKCREAGEDFCDKGTGSRDWEILKCWK